MLLGKDGIEARGGGGFHWVWLWKEKTVVKAKLAIMATFMLGKEGGEARGGMSTGFGAGKSSVCE